MIERDLKLLNYLEKFRVLSRDQIGNLVCSDTKNPSATASRICKRLGRDGYLTIIPRFRDQQYLYMPSPPIILSTSSKIDHFLAIADLFILLGCPGHFVVEPKLNDNYQPDVYTTINGMPIIVEVQRTKSSIRRMQEKADEFQKAYYRKEHSARILWYFCAESYDVKVEPNFKVISGLDIDAPLFQQI